MKIRNILCPVDFSDGSQSALAYATSIAKDHDAEIHIVYSYEEPFAYTDGAIPGNVPPADLAPDHKALDAMVPTGSDVRFRHQFLIGPPDRTLLEYAKTRNIDLIVLGTHGRTGLGRLLMGSVAEAIVRRAECPVVTIKTPSSVQVEDEASDGAPATE